MISFSFILLFIGEKQIEQGNAPYFAPQSISGGKFRLYIFISPINCSVMVGLNCITYGINKSVITFFY